MFDKRESAVSPVVAVILLLAIVGVIVGLAATAVFSNVDNILINDVKKVGVTVQVSVPTDKSTSDITVIPQSGKDLQYLTDYTVYFLGEDYEKSEKFSTDAIKDGSLKGKFENAFNPMISQITIVGYFDDGTDAVIFTGRIDDGYVVVPGGTADGNATPTGTPSDTTKYHVFYKADDKTEGTVPMDSNLYAPGDKTKLASGGDLRKMLGNNKYVVGGWYDDKNSYVTGYDYTVTDNVILYAVWVPPSVKFNKWNGNSFDMIGNLVNMTEYKDNIPNVQPSVLSNIIDCWYADEDMTIKWDFNNIMEDKYDDNPYDGIFNLYCQEYYPYFTYGTSSDSHYYYYSLYGLIDEINKWKKGTITVTDGDNYHYSTMTVIINKDIPLKNESISIKSWWSLTIKIDDNIVKTDYSVGGVSVYPSDTNPHIWASPDWDETTPLINLDGTLNVNGNLVIDGNNKMKSSVIKMNSDSSKLNVNGADLTILNGNNNGAQVLSDGGGICVSNGELKTTNGNIIIQNCISKLNGGGIYVNKGTVDIKCDISDCKSTFGGGFCVYPDNNKKAYVVIKGGSRFTSNTAQYPDNTYGAQGGGIYMNTANSFTLGSESDSEDIIISGNKADSSGGGIHVAYTSLNVKGNVLVDNNEVYCKNANGNADAEVKYGGGGIYLENGKMTLDGKLTVQNCKSYSQEGGNSTEEKGNGGGIYIYKNSDDIQIKSNAELIISGNTADNNGGGIYNAGTITNNNKILISGNTAKNNGGGMYNQKDDIKIGREITVIGNRAVRDGGGIYNTGKIIVDANNVLSVGDNTADNNGGGIYNNYALHINGGGELILENNNAVTNGNDIFNYNFIQGDVIKFTNKGTNRYYGKHDTFDGIPHGVRNELGSTSDKWEHVNNYYYNK